MNLSDVFLATAAGVVVLWALIPPLMHRLGLTQLQYQVWEDPAGAEPFGADRGYAQRFEQFTQLGFRPVGTSLESCWFFSPLHWHWRSVERQRWLTLPGGHTLASFHRLTTREPIRFGVVTFLSNGGRVRTTCPGTGIPAPGQVGSLRVELVQVEPAELWARHQEHADAFCADRNLTARTGTFAQAIATEAVLERRWLRDIKQRNTYALIFVSFVVPSLLAFGTIGYLWLHRFDWRVGALGILIGGLAFAWVRYVVIPAALKDAMIRSHGRRNG